MIQGFYSPIADHLDNFTWVYYDPLPFLEDNNITADLQNGGR